jgi:hypothetical protein
LAQIAEKHPDLTQVIKAWPTLPDHIRQAVMTIVKSAIQQEGEVK